MPRTSGRRSASKTTRRSTSKQASPAARKAGRPVAAEVHEEVAALARGLTKKRFKNEAGEILALPSQALCVGDPVTDMGGRIEVGVPSCTMFLHTLGDDSDYWFVLVARARLTLATRWELGSTGGVDSGFFGMWDADTERKDATELPVEMWPGLNEIVGRQTFAMRFHDGQYPCVVGRDDNGDVSLVLAGPGVHPLHFGIPKGRRRSRS